MQWWGGHVGAISAFPGRRSRDCGCRHGVHFGEHPHEDERTWGWPGQRSALVEACARTVAQAAKGHTIVVEKSTLPVRTAAAIKTILEEQVQGKISAHFRFCPIPSFWRKERLSAIWRPQIGC